MNKIYYFKLTRIEGVLKAPDIFKVILFLGSNFYMEELVKVRLATDREIKFFSRANSKTLENKSK